MQAERNCLGTFLSGHHGALFLSAWWGSQMYVSVEWLLENNDCVIAVIAWEKWTPHITSCGTTIFFLGGGGHLYFGDTISSLNKILNLTGYEPMSSKFDLRESAEAIEPSSFEWLTSKLYEMTSPSNKNERITNLLVDLASNLSVETGSLWY